MSVFSTHIIRSVDDVLETGLKLIRVPLNKKRTKNLEEFRAHYGQNPKVLAHQWEDLCESGKVTAQETLFKGFQSFMVAHYFLWIYPRNSKNLKSRFPALALQDSYGAPLWYWIKKIASLKGQKIVWKARLDDPNAEFFPLSVDGVDFKTHERKHQIYNIDKKAGSKKFGGACAAKYEIACSIWESDVVHVAGPFIGGVHDLSMFREGGLKEKLAPGKKVVVDRGYRSKDPEEIQCLAVPDLIDSKELHKFKSRARQRQESLNGRLKNYGILKHTYRHDYYSHKFVLEAVLVTVQYAMENGSPLFDV